MTHDRRREFMKKHGATGGTLESRGEPGSPEWLAAKSTGPKWSYQDGRGVEHIGYFQQSNDYGGTDVTYWFRDHLTGELTLCSGSRLKAAKRVY